MNDITSYNYAIEPTWKHVTTRLCCITTRLLASRLQPTAACARIRHGGQGEGRGQSELCFLEPSRIHTARFRWFHVMNLDGVMHVICATVMMARMLFRR